MPLDFEATPLRASDTERNLIPDALNGEVAFDLHRSTIETDGDWELSRDRDDARARLASIYNESTGQVAERVIDREDEQRLALPVVLHAYRDNAVKTNHVNPDIDMPDAA